MNVTLPDSEENYVHRIGRVGRAERMGLAISLVGAVRERVWFCPKGRKPPQRDTRDFDAGGNCVWYGRAARRAAACSFGPLAPRSAGRAASRPRRAAPARRTCEMKT